MGLRYLRQRRITHRLPCRSSSKARFSSRTLQQVIEDDLERLGDEELPELDSSSNVLPNGKESPPSELLSLPLIEEDGNATGGRARKELSRTAATDLGTNETGMSTGDEALTITVPQKDQHSDAGDTSSPSVSEQGASSLGPDENAMDSFINRIAVEWGSWTAILLIGCLNILALLGLTVISALAEDQKQGDGNSDAESVSSRSSDGSHSRPGSLNPAPSPPGTPATPLSAIPISATYASAPTPTQGWKELLKDETDNVILGLRVYTQTKDPAEILWRLAA